MIEKDGFEIVRNFYDVKNHTKSIPNLFEYTKTIKHLGWIDPQAKSAPAFANDLEMMKVQIKVLSKMESITGKKLFPTYNYFRLYNNESILEPHTDRPACEYSATLNIGYDGDYNWNIWIEGNDKKEYEVTLKPGDALIYKGCENKHWREPADDRVKCQSQVFLHYVEQDGKYHDHAFDARRKEHQ